MPGHSNYIWFECFILENLRDLVACFIAVHYWHTTVGKDQAVAGVIAFIYCSLNFVDETLPIEASFDYIIHILHS